MNYFTYVLPFENRTTPITLTCDYTITNTVTGVTSTISDATVTVPYEYAQMQPGYEYTYLFKITEGGKTVQLDDVKVEPWHYGGSQTENPWKNW